jgi:outer membrane protein TolC
MKLLRLAPAFLVFSLQPTSPLAAAATAATPPPAAVPPPVPDTLDLETAVKYALEHSYAILQARERIREQEGLIVSVRAQALPSLSLGATYGRNDPEIGSGTPRAYQSWLIALDARQTLYAGGAISAAIDAQRYAREAALLDLRATINQALLGVRTRFYAVLFAREQIKVQEQSVELLQEQLKDARNRRAAGTVSDFEVLRAEVELANAQPPLISARNNYRLAIDELRQALGYDNRTPENLRKIPEFTGTLEVAPAAYDLQAALDTARLNRPELQRLAQAELARDAAVRNARAGYRPNVALVGSYELVKKFGSNSFPDSPLGWTVGLQGSWAIFDGKLTDGRVAQAKSQLDQARLTRAEQTLAVEVEVRRALSSLQEATELVDAAKQVVRQAEEALRLAAVRNSAGTATQLDVLSTQVALTQARNNRLSADYRQAVALATLRTALGEADAYAPGR